MGRKKFWRAEPLSPGSGVLTASREEIEGSGGIIPARPLTAVWVQMTAGRFALSGVFPARSDALRWVSANHVGDFVLLSSVCLTVSTQSPFQYGGCSPFKSGEQNPCQTVENKSPSRTKSSPPSNTTD